MYGIYANIGGILMVNVTIYTIHGSYGIYCHLASHHQKPSRASLIPLAKPRFARSNLRTPRRLGPLGEMWVVRPVVVTSKNMAWKQKHPTWILLHQRAFFSKALLSLTKPVSNSLDLWFWDVWGWKDQGDQEEYQQLHPCGHVGSMSHWVSRNFVLLKCSGMVHLVYDMSQRC